jgi:hypothetical protein
MGEILFSLIYYYKNLLFICFYFQQAAGFPEPEIIHYNPKEFDFGKKKAFPFRDQVNCIAENMKNIDK